LTNGSTLSTGYDSAANAIVFHAHVKVGTYLSIGFNSSMMGTDMISWQAGSTAATS